mgnify:CR=1 FL=1
MIDDLLNYFDLFYFIHLFRKVSCKNGWDCIMIIDEFSIYLVQHLQFNIHKKRTQYLQRM